MQEKKCSKCKEVKSLNDFSRDITHSDGLRSSCKKCNCKIIKNKNCKFCKKSFKPYTTISKFCSAKCMVDNQKSKRSFNWGKEKCKNITGKNNPAYRNGNYCRSTKKTDIGQKEFIRNAKELKQKIVDEHGYIHCQDCGINNSLRFETHHIVFRSEKPLHENLHKKENLIVLCIKCHNEYHKKKGKRNKLVEDRGLQYLFGNDVLINKYSSYE